MTENDIERRPTCRRVRLWRGLNLLERTRSIQDGIGTTVVSAILELRNDTVKLNQVNCSGFPGGSKP